MVRGVRVRAHGDDRYAFCTRRDQALDEIAAVSVRQPQVEQDCVMAASSGERDTLGACPCHIHYVSATLEQVLREVRIRFVVLDQQDTHAVIPVDDEAKLPTLLVVDDDERTRELLRLVLAAEGYRVVTAADGPAALEQIRARVPDVTLIDLVMRGMDGIEVCRRARQLAPSERMSIVVLSGMDDPAVRRLALEAGADAFMTKPFDRSELRECLARMRRARLKS